VALLRTEPASPLLEAMTANFDDLLFAELSARPELILVEREDLGKVLTELELGVVSVTSPAGAARIGRWTGARLLLSSRAVAMPPGIRVVTRILGIETGRVHLVTTEAQRPAEFPEVARALAAELGTRIATKSSDLLVGRAAHGPTEDGPRTAPLASKPRPLLLLALTHPAK
jgi:hypothetical protein